jgi:hypothetical protein
MQPTITFLTWAIGLLFIGLIILMGRKYILRSVPDRMVVSGTTKILLILGVLIMAIGTLLLVAMPFVP